MSLKDQCYEHDEDFATTPDIAQAQSLLSPGVCLSVCLSVSLSVRHVGVLYLDR